MKDIKIVKAKRKNIKSFSKVLFKSFKKESGTRYIFNYSDKESRMFLFKAFLLRNTLRFRSGQVFLAKSNNKIVGGAVLYKDSRHLSIKKIVLFLPEVIKIIPKISVLKVISILRLRWLDKQINQEYYTLEVLAVDSNYQRRGIGSKILSRVLSVAEKRSMGIYLTTASKKNERFYKKFGFKTIQRKVGEGIVIYHMYKKFYGIDFLSKKCKLNYNAKS